MEVQICFQMIILVLIYQFYSNPTHVSLITHGRHLSILGSRGQRTRSQVRVVNICLQICFQMIISVCISQLDSSIKYVSLITQGNTIDFWVKRLNSKVSDLGCLQTCFCIRNLFLFQTTVFKKTLI